MSLNLLDQVLNEIGRNNYALPKAAGAGALVSGSICFLCTGTVAVAAIGVAMSVAATALSVFAKQALISYNKKMPAAKVEIAANALSFTALFAVKALLSPATAGMHLFAGLCFSTIPQLFTQHKTPVIFV